MASPDIPILASVEEYVISSNLNSSMLENFLMGIYTMVYGATVYLYSMCSHSEWAKILRALKVTKKPANANRHVVLTAISVLYLLSFMDFTFSWYFVDWSLVVNRDTQDSMFWSTLGGPIWLDAFDKFLFDASFVVSDGLLIWRCYHVWGKSLEIIALPSLLLVAESALGVTDMVFHSIFSQNNSEANVAIGNNIATALIFMSLGTTVSATSLIVYRLHTASQNNISRSQRIYSGIVTKIVESSAAYSLVLLFYAITGVITIFNDPKSPLFQAQYYIQTLLTNVSGMAPTIMVARLALINPSNTVSSGTITHISGMNFGSQQGSCGGASTNAISGRNDPSAGDIENAIDQAKQVPVMELKQESNAHDIIDRSPV